MNLIKVIQELKSRLQKPLVYSLVMRNDRKGELQLFQVIGFRLEDALSQVFDELVKKKSSTEDSVRSDWMLLMWVSRPLYVFAKEVEDLRYREAEPAPEDSIKNALMKTIVETKDRALLERNLEMFTENEIKYLEERL